MANSLGSTIRELGELLTMIDGSPFVICIHRSKRRGSGTPSAISRFASHGTIKTPCTAKNSVHLSTISVRKNSRKVHRISKSAPKI